MHPPILTLELPGLKRLASGKVRDIYDLDNSLLLVATDRVSAFDVVMPNGIPDKGRVLTQLSSYWFKALSSIASHHCISTDDAFILKRLSEAGAQLTPAIETALRGRAMLCVKAEPFSIECVVRGYLAGSLWKEYRLEGGIKHPVTLHGIPLPAGLRECDILPAPIFSPATKAVSGHDENIGIAEVIEQVGNETANSLETTSLSLYKAAARRAEDAGIILADTKFEFGLHNGKIIWIDEALTPDSSRYWEPLLYRPGSSQPSFDKQFVRDWLENTGWNKEPPAPLLPDYVVERTAEKYREAFRRLTGAPLSEE